MFSVAVEPIEARLEPAFKLAALSVESGQDAKKLIQKYGTHFPTVVHYGGDRSVYVVMNKDQYSKAKGYGLDVRVEVGKSKNQVTDTSYTRKSDNSWSTTDNYGDSKVASGSLGFSYSEDEQAKEV